MAVTRRDRGLSLDGRRPPLVVALGLLVFALSCTFAVGGLRDGRTSGDIAHYETVGKAVAHGHVPYRDFYLEYPPGALPAFVVPALISERHYATTFKLAMTLCGALTLVAAAALLAALDATPIRLALGVGAIAIAPALLGNVYLNRFDPWPALLVTLALLLLVVGRVRGAAALLAVSVVAKIYAVVTLPPASIRVWRTRGRGAFVRGAAVAVAVAAVIALPFAAVAPGGVGFSFYTQSTRALQSESLGASLLLVADRLGIHHVHYVEGKAISLDVAGTLGSAIGVLSSIVTIAAVLAVAFAYLHGDDERERIVTAFAAAVTAYVAFFKVLSPQYLTWLVPLVPLVWGRRGRAATGLLLVALLLTQIEHYGWSPVHGVPGTNRIVGEPRAWLPWVLLARNVALVAIFGLLASALSASRAARRAVVVRAAPDAGPGSCSDPTAARSPSSSAAARRG